MHFNPFPSPKYDTFVFAGWCVVQMFRHWSELCVVSSANHLVSREPSYTLPFVGCLDQGLDCPIVLPSYNSPPNKLSYSLPRDSVQLLIYKVSSPCSISVFAQFWLILIHSQVSWVSHIHLKVGITVGMLPQFLCFLPCQKIPDRFLLISPHWEPQIGWGGAMIHCLSVIYVF